MTDKRNLMTVIKRIAFTLLIILIYIMGTYIPVPFADITARYEQILNSSSLSIMGIMSGASLSRLSIFSLGINPFMIVMLIMQLLMFTKIFGVDALSVEQVQNLQQFLILILTVVQAVLFTYSMIPERNLKRDATVVLILTAGSLIVVWFTFINTKYGIGGGMPIILVNILSSIIPTIYKTIKDLRNVDNFYWLLGLLLAIILVSIYFWVAFIHTYYPLKVINTSLPSYEPEVIFPIGLNMGAMMTYMTGMALLMIPAMLRPYFPADSIINQTSFQVIFTAVLTFLLFYFFTFMQFPPKDQARNFRDEHNYIPNIRPGRPTQIYLRKLLLVITFPGAILTAVQLTLGLFGVILFGKYAGLAVIPMNAVMLAMFISGMKDQVITLLYPYKYDRYMKEI
ncbi:accessory Sec system protein translocase subunit SecY2 [Lactobacillus kitasatonis]|uniref:accessory Sec system protein translocase subunit SecY2 n=1 Tax=Lactobacillus kitasatonis TaxID=237446 RepID=UPI0026F242BD|nr:accessory Sec system protein translocase subunit SecY2 [Lactobacillus kitasatonis]